MPVKQVCKRDNGARTCMENVSEKWEAGRCLCSAMPDCAHAGRAGHHPTGSFPVCVASCPTHPCLQQGAEGRMRQCLTSLSLLSTLSRLCSFQPPSWLPVGDTTAPSREKKIVLPFAHQVLSVVPLLCPAQRGVVAQTTARKRNTQVFQHLSLPTKKQGNSSFHQRNARV